MKFYKEVPKKADSEFSSIEEFAKYCRQTTERFKMIECSEEEAQFFFIEYRNQKYQILIVESYEGIYSMQNDRGLIPREFVKEFIKQWDISAKRERLLSLLLNRYSDISYADNRGSVVVSRVTTSQVASKKTWQKVLKGEKAEEPCSWEHGNKRHNKENYRTY